MSSGFRNIEISCFRGIDHLNIDGLARVNVFVGANNVGKTSILEAVFMLSGMSNPLMPTRVNYWRNVTAGTVDGARYLFHNLDFNARPLLEAGTEAGVRWLTFEPVLANEAGAASSAAYSHSTIKRLEFHFGIKGGDGFSGSSSLFLDKDGNMQQTTASGYVENMNCLYLSADKNDGNASTNFATLVKRNGKQQVVDALRGFDKSIETIEALPDGLYLKVKGVMELLPVCMAGDGVRRMVNIVSSIANEDYNMLLIDEFDNIGWLVTDRRQPNGKVCIYTFVPAETRTAYDIEAVGESKVESLADIRSISDTWTDDAKLQAARARLKAMTARKSDAGRSQMAFVVNDRTVYTSAADFKSPTNRQRFTKLCNMKDNAAELAESLDDMRLEYAKGSSASKRQLGASILKAERQFETLEANIKKLEKEIRNTENMMGGE